MPRFDISNAADFSRLTQGTIGNLNSLFGGRDPKEWDIVEASWNGIKFHVFQMSTIFNSQEKTRWEGGLARVTDMGGRRKVKYQFPYRDGQTTDDLGAEPETFEMEAVVHGPRYMEGYNLLRAEFAKPTPGLLMHPVRGEITCVVSKVDITHSADARKSIELRLTFMEHNFTVGDIRAMTDDSVKAALAAALAVFKFIDTAISKIEGAQLLVRGIKNLIKSYLNVYKVASAQTLTSMNMTFNTKAGSADIPALLPVNLGGSGTSTGIDGIPTASSPLGSSMSTLINGPGGTISSDGNFIVVKSVSDPFNGVPVEQLTRSTIVAVAVTELSKQVQALRVQIGQIITTINDNGASLELFDTVIELRQSIVLIQQVLEKGVASSNARIVDYTVPILMSLREIAFANGIGVERVQELDLLNPQLLSVNYVAKGTVVRLPTS